MSEEETRVSPLGPGQSIVQFAGESDWDAFVSHYGFNIEEEDDFISFLEANGTAPGRCTLWQLDGYYQQYQRLNQGS